MTGYPSKLAEYEHVLHAAATRQVAGRRRRTRRIGVGGLAALAAVLVTGAALAGDVDLASVLPGYSVSQTPVVSPAEVSAQLPADSAAISPAAIASLMGVDVAQLHRVSSTRYGITVLVAPKVGGGVCAAYIQHQTVNTQCGDASALGIGIPIIEIPEHRTLYVGLRPDGVTSVTAVDGSSVPVIDNVFISEGPVEP
jgi:hypothetical protein